jgi:hypothetical protein
MQAESGDGAFTFKNATDNTTAYQINTSGEFLGLDVNGNVIITGNLTVNGTTTAINTAITISDAMVINNAGTDVGIKVNSTSTGHIMQLQDNGTDVLVVADGGNVTLGGIDPITDDAHDLGSGAKRWQNVYTANIGGSNNGENDENTVLLIHSDTFNNSTSFKDSSASRHSITKSGETKHSTGQSRFGATSIYFDSNDDYLEVSPSSDFQTTGNFTIDFWMWSSDSGAACMWEFRDVSDTSLLYMDHVNSSEVQYCIGGSTCVKINPPGTASVSNSTWHHVAIVRDSSTSWYFFWDGVAQTPTTGSLTANLTHNIGSNIIPLRIGENYPSTAGYGGYIDEFRCSNVARWTANFAVPTREYRDFGIKVTTGMGPVTNNAQDLGSEEKRWRNVFTTDLQLSNENTGGNIIDGTEGNWTMQEGDENMYFINNKTRKRYKIKLEEV